jgi:hypothetical protein
MLTGPYRTSQEQVMLTGDTLTIDEVFRVAHHFAQHSSFCLDTRHPLPQ